MLLRVSVAVLLIWIRGLVRSVLSAAGEGGVRPPPSGLDAGDHPPITPMRASTRQQLRCGGDPEWRLYEYISRHFVASLLPPIRYSEHVCTLRLGSERFTYTWHTLLAEGWAVVCGSRILSPVKACRARGFELCYPPPLRSNKCGCGAVQAMPWRLAELGLNTNGAVAVAVGDAVAVLSAALAEGVTEPPPYLREHDLIEAMDRHGIGTDASIPTHVQNISKVRKYVTVCDSAGRPVPEVVDSEGGKSKGKGGRDSKGGGRGKGKAVGRHMVAGPSFSPACSLCVALPS